ncbi:hypothetical protein KPH14_013082 [Odynerus spinipes]|uniref:Uncharacterized protein n=1 Tax=Odynerus spinipes TaxID=1348599 RepID=A0AAD9VHN2_9HYME|nr:hypothetical protein KPH14_013082 [Odynerus spinipes]
MLSAAPKVYRDFVAKTSSNSRDTTNDESNSLNESVPLTRDATVRRYILTLASLAALIIVAVYVLVEFTRIWLRSVQRGNQEQFARTRDFNRVKLKRLFDPSYAENAGATSSNDDEKISRDRDKSFNKNLLGPLVPRDCDANRTICLSNNNCKLLCRNAAIIDYTCNEQNVCEDRSIVAEEGIGISDSDETGARECDTKNGEFALLQGYNEVGLAQWNCVNIYPGWQDKSKYCENGKVDIDARVREPSYADCKCPSGTSRMVYRRSLVGQNVYGLPHCIKNKKFFELDYMEI